MATGSYGFIDPDEEDYQREAMPQAAEDRASTNLRSPDFQLPADTQAQEPAGAEQAALSEPPVQSKRIAENNAASSPFQSALANYQAATESPETADYAPRQGYQAQYAKDQQATARGSLRALKAQGVETEIGPDGREAIATHDDGTARWKPERGQPVQDEQGNWFVPHRNDRGDLEQVPIDETRGITKTDPHTGERYFLDSANRPVSVGTDQTVAQRIQLQQQKALLRQQEAESNFAIAQLRAGLQEPKAILASLRQSAASNPDDLSGGLPSGGTDAKTVGELENKIKSLSAGIAAGDRSPETASQLTQAQQAFEAFKKRTPDYATYKQVVEEGEKRIREHQDAVMSARAQKLALDGAGLTGLATAPQPPAGAALQTLSPTDAHPQSVDTQAVLTAAQDGSSNARGLTKTLARLKASGMTTVGGRPIDALIADSQKPPAALPAPAAKPEADTGPGWIKNFIGSLADGVISSLAADAQSKASLSAWEERLAEKGLRAVGAGGLADAAKRVAEFDEGSKQSLGKIRGYREQIRAGEYKPDANTDATDQAQRTAAAFATGWINPKRQQDFSTGVAHIIPDIALMFGAPEAAIPVFLSKGGLEGVAEADDKGENAAVGGVKGLAKTAATLALFHGAGKLASKLTPEFEAPFARFLAGTGAAAALNSAADVLVNSLSGGKAIPETPREWAERGLFALGFAAVHGIGEAKMPDRLRAALKQTQINAAMRAAETSKPGGGDPQTLQAIDAQLKELGSFLGAHEFAARKLGIMPEGPKGSETKAPERPPLADQVRDSLASVEAAEQGIRHAAQNGDLANAAHLRDYAGRQQEILRQLDESARNQVAPETRAEIARRLGLDPAAAEQHLTSRPDVPHVTAAVGREARDAYLHPETEKALDELAKKSGNDKLAQHVADQHVGLLVGRDLGAILKNEAVPENRMAKLEEMGLVEHFANEAGTGSEYHVTDDALPLISEPLRSAVKRAPEGRFRLTVAPGEPGAMRDLYARQGRNQLLAAVGAQRAPVEQSQTPKLPPREQLVKQWKESTDPKAKKRIFEQIKALDAQGKQPAAEIPPEKGQSKKEPAASKQTAPPKSEQEPKKKVTAKFKTAEGKQSEVTLTAPGNTDEQAVANAAAKVHREGREVISAEVEKPPAPEDANAPGSKKIGDKLFEGLFASKAEEKRGAAPKETSGELNVGGAVLTPPGDSLAASKAYHGTPHKVDRFSTDKIGTGEGAQAYGWGLYFAENPEVAESYRRSLSGKKTIRYDGQPFDASNPKHFAAEALTKPRATREREIERLRMEAYVNKGLPHASKLEEAARVLESNAEAKREVYDKPDGNTYGVSLDVEPEELLDWDKPLGEQPAVREKLLSSLNIGVHPGDSGADLYRDLADEAAKRYGERSRKSTSRLLLDSGIQGIRYLDQGSRIAPAAVDLARKNLEEAKTTGKPQIIAAAERELADIIKQRDEGGTYNYVIFDESKIKITHENGQELTPSEALAASKAEAAAKLEQRGFPREKLETANQMAHALIEEGVKTPEALADYLETHYGGKARPFSQALWNALAVADPNLSGKQEWSEVYAKHDAAKEEARKAAEAKPEAPDQPKWMNGLTEHEIRSVELVDKMTKVGGNRDLMKALGFKAIRPERGHGKTSGLAVNNGFLIVYADDLAKQFDRLSSQGVKTHDYMGKVLREEIIHLAQFKLPDWQERHADIWNDPALPQDLRDAAAKSYEGFDSLPDHAKGAEVVRMVVQQRWTGTITERVFKMLEDVLNYLRGLKVDGSDLLSETVRDVEAVLEKAKKQAGIEERPTETDAERRLRKAFSVDPAPKLTEMQTAVLRDLRKAGVSTADEAIRQNPILENHAEAVRAHYERGDKAARNFTVPYAPMGIPDLVDAVVEQGGIKLPPKGERRQEYDAAPEKLPGVYRRLLSADGKLSADDMAMQLFDEGRGPLREADVELMWSELTKAINQRISIRKGEAARAKTQREEQKKFEAFDKAASTPKEDARPIHVENLSVGDEVKVGTETMKVVDVDPDGNVTLQDGSKFGIQRVQDGDVIYGEVTKDIPEGQGDFLQPEETAPAAEQPKPTLPQLRPNEKGTSELFQGKDQPFNLAGETGVDYEKKAREKEQADQEAAEAKAKQDKEQTTMFGEEPTVLMEPAKPKEPKEPAGLQDFGEKLGGARKDIEASMRRQYSDADIERLPLSEIWPKAEVDAIADIPLASLATAARAVIPAKPRSPWKVRQWAEKVKQVRELMRIAGEQGYDAVMKRMGEHRILHELASKVRLLQSIPREHWDRVGRVWDYPDAFQYKRDADGNTVFENGKMVQVPSPTAGADVDGRSVSAKNLSELADAVSAKLGGEAPADRMKFEVRGREGRGFFINKKGDPLHRKLKTFESSKEALDYARDPKSYDALVSAWGAVKESDNVKETDVRRATNAERAGKDWRNGKDATPEMFTDSFGFRGAEFGNWVSQGKNIKERQGMLNAAFDALHDLADVANVPPKAISLNGTLGLGFGSRGHGWASAHFEPGNLVINLTKTRGAGSLAHEWFHALDNYFQRKRNETGIAGRHGDYITNNPETYYEGPNEQRLSETRYNELASRRFNADRLKDWKRVEGVRPEVAEAFAELVKALDASPMTKRAELIDKGKSDGYWSRVIERAARSFESYVIAKMQLEGVSNDYLANVVSVEDFARDKGRYPYLLPDEIAPVSKAFDDLFSTLKTKETDKGVALYASKAEGADDHFTPALYEAEKKKYQVFDPNKLPAPRPVEPTVSERMAIESAYKEAVLKSGFPAVKIADVLEAAGFGPNEMERGRGILNDLYRKGEVVLSLGDWSIANDRERAWTVPLYGQRYLQARFLEPSGEPRASKAPESAAGGERDYRMAVFNRHPEAEEFGLSHTTVKAGSREEARQKAAEIFRKKGQEVGEIAEVHEDENGKTSFLSASKAPGLTLEERGRTREGMSRDDAAARQNADASEASSSQEAALRELAGLSNAKFRKKYLIHLMREGDTPEKAETIMREGIKSGWVSSDAISPNPIEKGVNFRSGFHGWARTNGHDNAGRIALVFNASEVSPNEMRLRQGAKPVAWVQLTRNGQSAHEAIREQINGPRQFAPESGIRDGSFDRGDGFYLARDGKDLGAGPWHDRASAQYAAEKAGNGAEVKTVRGGKLEGFTLNPDSLGASKAPAPDLSAGAEGGPKDYEARVNYYDDAGMKKSKTVIVSANSVKEAQAKAWHEYGETASPGQVSSVTVDGERINERPPKPKGGMQAAPKKAKPQAEPDADGIPGLKPENGGPADETSRDLQPPAEADTAKDEVTGKNPSAESLIFGPVVKWSPTRLFRGVADVLERTQGLESLGKAVRRHVDTARNYQAVLTAPYRKWDQTFSRGERNTGLEEFKNYWQKNDTADHADAQGIYAAASPAGKALIDLWKETARRTAEVNSRNALLVRDPETKAFRKIGTVSRYFPRSMRPEVVRLIKNPMSNLKAWQEVVRAFVKDGLIKKEPATEGGKAEPLTEAEFDLMTDAERRNASAQAFQHLTKAYSLKASSDYLGNIEAARQMKLPTMLYDYSFDAARRYMMAWSERMGQIEAYGQAAGKTKDAFDLAAEKTTDPGTAEYIRRAQDRAYGVRDTGFFARLMSAANSIATLTMLSNPVTIGVNLASGLAYNATHFGVGRAIASMGQMLKAGKQINDAYERGVLLDDLMGMHRDVEEMGSPLLQQRIQDATGKVLKWTGYNLSEEFVRAHGLVTAKAFLRSALKAFAGDPEGVRGAKEYRAFLARHYFDPQMIAQLVAENGKGEMTNRFLRESINAAQGGYRFDQVPIFVDSPTGRFLFKFQKWGTQQTRLFADHVLAPLKKGNIAPLLRYALVTGVVGAGIDKLKELLSGTPDRTASWEEIGKTMNEDQKRGLALIASKAWTYQLAAGATGSIGNYWQSLSDIAERSRFKNPMEPPGVAIVENLGELGFRAIEQKKLTAADLDDFARSQLALYRTGKAAAAKGLDALGADFRTQQTEIARQNLQWLHVQTRRFTDDPAIQLEQKRTSAGRVAKTPETPFRRDLQDALSIGDTAGARQLLIDHLQGLTPEQKKTEWQKLKSSVLQRRPIRIGSSTDDGMQAVFLAWAQKRLPAEDVARLKEIDGTYRQSAAAVGLMSPQSPVPMKKVLKAEKKLGIERKPAMAGA